MTKCDFCERDAVAIGADGMFEPVFLCGPCSNAFDLGARSPEHFIAPIGDLLKYYPNYDKEDYPDYGG